MNPDEMKSLSEALTAPQPPGTTIEPISIEFTVAPHTVNDTVEGFITEFEFIESMADGLGIEWTQKKWDAEIDRFVKKLEEVEKEEV